VETMTIGETKGVDHVKSLFEVIIPALVSEVLPNIIGASKTDDIHLELDIDGTPVTVDIPGVEVDNMVADFVAHFNCSEFVCVPDLLAADGDLDGDATTNYESYTAAADRQDWLIGESLQNPPLQVLTQPASQTTGSGIPVSFSLTYAEGFPGGPVEYRWELTDPADLLPGVVVSTL